MVEVCPLQLKQHGIELLGGWKCVIRYTNDHRIHFYLHHHTHIIYTITETQQNITPNQMAILYRMHIRHHNHDINYTVEFTL